MLMMVVKSVMVRVNDCLEDNAGVYNAAVHNV